MSLTTIFIWKLFDLFTNRVLWRTFGDDFFFFFFFFFLNWILFNFIIQDTELN
jgi:hypothetical protein